MAPSDLPRDPSDLGLPSPTVEFCRITTTREDAGRALVDGVVAIPGLPVCRVRMKTDVERIARYGPGRQALLSYVRAALYEDVVVELPWN